MSTNKRQSQKAGSRWVLGCVVIGVLVILLGVGVGTVILLRGRLTGRGVTAWISAPTMDQQAEVNQPLVVQAGAAYLSGASRLEVYADGALVLAQDASGNGENELALSGTWTPLTTGRHALLARGYGANGLFADSEIVYVDVVEPPESITIDVDSLPRAPGAPNPSLDVLSQYLGTTADELARRNPGLSGTSHDAPLPPGSRIEAPRPPSSPPSPPSPPSPRSGTPAAPTLAGTADCTSVTLNWSASVDAQSYRVYRLGARRSRIADNLRTITYRDTLSAPGTYTYQVASVRDGQEGFSLPFTVSTPAGCSAPSAPPGTSADLILTIAMVDTDVAWDGLYCYLSINGRPNEHIPAGDFSFVAPETSNNKYYNLTRLPGRGRMDLTGQPLTSPVTLHGHCFGRRGPSSTELGEFSVSHPQADWNGTLRSASSSGYRFSYCLGPSSATCTPTIPGTTTPASGIFLDIPIDLFFLPAPTNLRRTASTAACDDLPDLFDRLACSGSGFFCMFGGCEARQTVFWDWTGTTFVPESSLTSYTVIRTIYNQSTGERLMSNLWDVNRRSDGTLPKRFLSEDTDLHCGQRVEYRVRANQASRRSALSDPISFETERCPTAAQVLITFDTLQVGAVNDTNEEYFMGIPDPTRNANLEVLGDIYATDYLSIRTTSIYSSGPIYSRVLEQGTYNWRNIVTVNSFSVLVLNDSQTVTVGVTLNEIDTDWTRTVTRRTTPWCVARMVLPAQSLERWGRLNQPFTLSGGNAEAACTITGRVVGTLVR